MNSCSLTLFKQAFFVFSICGFSLTCCSQSLDDLNVEQLGTYLTTMHAVNGLSGEILIAKDTNILFQKAVGLASIENSLDLKLGATYKVASISKTFTGTLIALALEEQKLSIDDRIVDYLEGLSTKFEEITIEQLLTHTSGLPHNEGIKDYWLVKSKLSLTEEEIMEEINALDLLHSPGENLSYSSLGYYLLAVILERVYEDDFENILRKNILQKIKMSQTGTVNFLKIIPRMATGYHFATDDSLVVAPYRNYSLVKGAGDMYSSTIDLLKWTNSFTSNTILSEKSKALMFGQSARKDERNGGRYGFGWRIHDTAPQKFYHGGGTWGYTTHLALYPEHGISIIILCNVSTLPISAIAADVEKIVFRKPFEMPTVGQINYEGKVKLDMYSGTFVSSDLKMKLKVILSEGHVYAQVAGRPPFQIHSEGNHHFFGKKVGVKFRFDVQEDEVIGLETERMGGTIYFNKVKE